MYASRCGEVCVLTHLGRLKSQHDVFTRDAFTHQVRSYAVFGCIFLNPNLPITQPDIEMCVKGALPIFPSQRNPLLVPAFIIKYFDFLDIRIGVAERFDITANLLLDQLSIAF